MIAKDRRAAILVVLHLQRLMTYLWAFAGMCVIGLVHVLISIFAIQQRGKLRRMLAQSTAIKLWLTHTADAIAAGGLTDRRIRVLLRAETTHQEKLDRLHEQLLRFNSEPSLPLRAAIGLRGAIDRRIKRRGSIVESLRRVTLRAHMDTFYAELGLWLVLPSTFADEALGDLEEQFHSLSLTTGREKALAWYRRQLRLELSNCLWRKVERFAALSALVELAHRYFKK